MQVEALVRIAVIIQEQIEDAIGVTMDQKRPTGTDEDANVEWSSRRNVNVPAGNTKENLK
jgi:hypothetical protein